MTEGGGVRGLTPLFVRLALLWLLFAVPLAVLKAGNDYVIGPKLIVAALGALMILGALAISGLLRRLRSQPLALALLAWLIAGAVSLPAAVNRPQAVLLLIQQAGWAALAASALLVRPGLGKCLAVCALSLAVQFAVALLQLSGHWVVGHGEQFGPGRIYATLGNPSFFGIYLAPLAAWLLTGTFLARGRGPIWRILALGVCLFLMFKSQVIDAWAGFGLGGALGVWLVLGRSRRAGLIGLAALVLAAALGAGLLLPRLEDRLAYLKVKAFSWHAAVRLWLEHPVTGAGPGGFQAEAPLAMNKVHRIWTREWNVPEALVWPHDEAFVHQDILQMLSETGVLGAGAWLWLAVVAFRAGLCAAARDPSRAAWLAGLMAFLPTMSFHFPLNLAPSALLFWFSLGFAGRRAGSPEPGAPLGYPAAIAVGALLAGAGLYTIRGIPANVLLGEGHRLQLSGEAVRALGYFERYEKLNPYGYEERFYAGAAHQAAGNYARAIESYERALDLYPGFQGAAYNLANVALARGQYARAVELYDRAIAINPCFVEAVNNRGNARDQMGDREGAIRDYLRAVEIKPDYADALYNLAFDAYRQNDKAAAKAWLRAALKSDPKHGPALALAPALWPKGER